MQTSPLTLSRFDPRRLWEEKEPTSIQKLLGSSSYSPRPSNISPQSTPPPSPVKGSSQRFQPILVQQQQIDPLRKVSLFEIMTSSRIESALGIKQSIIDYTAYTYKMIYPHLDKSQNDSIDRAIDSIPNKISSYNKENLNNLEKSAQALSQEYSGFDDVQCEKINQLIVDSIAFSNTKSNTEFPTFFKINVIGWSYSLITLALVKANIIDNIYYFLHPFTLVLAFTTISTAYRIIWLKCRYQSILTSRAESLRITAKEVFSLFQIKQQ